MIAQTPKPPYYAVIFTSVKSSFDEGYSEMAEKMMNLAAKQPGFLGVETARENMGITVSYWEDLQSIKMWKDHAEHSIARELGRKKWYNYFKTRIAKVESDYGFQKIEEI